MEDSILKFSKNLNVLYVEDEAVTRRTTTAMLEKYFASVVAKKDGSEGYSLEIYFPWRLLLLDACRGRPFCYQ